MVPACQHTDRTVAACIGGGGGAGGGGQKIMRIDDRDHHVIGGGKGVGDGRIGVALAWRAGGQVRRCAAPSIGELTATGSVCRRCRSSSMKSSP